MLISKTPLRVSFLGGGTDFPWFFNRHGGAVISTTINRYIYISALPSYDGKTTFLKYSNLETVELHADIRHPIFRSILVDYNLPKMDWSVMADIPAGNGLASSSAFTVGLVNLASHLKGQELPPNELALEAVRFELDVLKEPIGLQDQFASAVGGLNVFKFSKDRQVYTSKLTSTIEDFPFGMVLVKVGKINRSASKFTKAQEVFVQSNQSAIDDLSSLRDLTIEASEAIERDPGELVRFVRLGWELKQKTNPSVASDEINETIAFALKNGAEAGKLVGAGGSGFVLLLTSPSKTCNLVSLLLSRGQKTFEVEFEEKGSRLVEI
jgi:D-glycero-alpha-D-manno-heptose-7-phosphate kinase